MRKTGLLAALLAATAPAAPAALHAQDGASPAIESAAAPDYESRARQLVDWLNGDLDTGEYFSDYFLGVMPESRLVGLRDDIIETHGRAVRAQDITHADENAGTLSVLFETEDGKRTTGHVELTIDPQAPHRVIGLMITRFEVADDSFARIEKAFADLPGEAGFAVAELGPGGPRLLAARHPEKQFAIGSTFKLYVLAELASAVREGHAGWFEVVPLGKPSLPSGVTQDWPKGLPVTLATLATMMISMSDNSAADTLMHELGRRQVGARLAKIGHGDPDKALPVLTTLEAFALKMGANSDMREAYLAASEADQPRLIDNFGERIDRDMIRPAELAGKPLYIDSIEWFASPVDLVALLTYLKRLDDNLPLEIMAVSPGVGTGDAARWDYLGYKGGSEPGVINMSFLGRRKDGQWVAVTGSWNDEGAAVDDAAFAGLMNRLLDEAVD